MPLTNNVNAAADHYTDEEIVMTPVQTRAASPSRARVMPHTVAEADAFMANLNALAAGESKGKGFRKLSYSIMAKVHALHDSLLGHGKAVALIYAALALIAVLVVELVPVDDWTEVKVRLGVWITIGMVGGFLAFLLLYKNDAENADGEASA